MRKDKHLEILAKFGISRIKKHVYKQDREKGELWVQTLGVSRAEMGKGPPMITPTKVHGPSQLLHKCLPVRT